MIILRKQQEIIKVKTNMKTHYSTQKIRTIREHNKIIIKRTMHSAVAKKPERERHSEGLNTEEDKKSDIDSVSDKEETAPEDEIQQDPIPPSPEPAIEIEQKRGWFSRSTKTKKEEIKTAEEKEQKEDDTDPAKDTPLQARKRYWDTKETTFEEQVDEYNEKTIPKIKEKLENIRIMLGIDKNDKRTSEEFGEEAQKAQLRYKTVLEHVVIPQIQATGEKLGIQLERTQRMDAVYEKQVKRIGEVAEAAKAWRIKKV